MKARASVEDSGVLLCKLLKDIAVIMLSTCIQWDPAFKKVHLKKQCTEISKKSQFIRKC